VLREWFERDNPQVDDQIAVRFLGRDELPDGTTQLQFEAGTVRAAAREPTW
jgi:hypothetical protein